MKLLFENVVLSLVIVFFLVCIVSCKSYGRGSIDKDIKKSTSIVRVVFVNHNGSMRAKRVELLKHAKGAKPVNEYPPYLNLHKINEGDEWVIFYRSGDFSSGGKDYVAGMVRVKDGKIQSVPGLTLEELRSRCMGK